MVAVEKKKNLNKDTKENNTQLHCLLSETEV